MLCTYLGNVVDLLAAAGKKESDAERVSRFLPFSDGKYVQSTP